MAEDQEDKTEEPSQRKLEKSREEGDVPSSREVTAFLVFGTILMLFQWWFPSQMSETAIHLSSYIDFYRYINVGWQVIARQFIADIIQMTAVPLLVLLVISISSYLLQRGIIFAPKLVGFKLSRISMIAGFKRLFSLESVVKVVKATVKSAIVIILFYYCVIDYLWQIASSHQLTLGSVVLFWKEVSIRVLMWVTICMLFIAILDFAYQKYQYLNKLKMSKQELKEEFKAQEGSQEVKQKQKAKGKQLVEQRSISKAKNADVVLVNPTHYAVALKYDGDTMPAPKVIAKGMDDVALAIKRLAIDSFIPVVENPELTRWLYDTVSINRYIDPEQYEAVAAVIKYVRKVKAKPR